MRHCDLEALSRYVDGELTLPEGVHVQEHLRSCVGCSEELEALRRMNSVLMAWGARRTPVPLSTDIRMRRALEDRPRWAPISALSRMMPAAVGTTVAAMLLAVSVNAGLVMQPQQSAGAPTIAAQTHQRLVKVSRPLMSDRRTSALFGSHPVIAERLPTPRRLFFDLS